jgi:hypothetical protein
LYLSPAEIAQASMLAAARSYDEPKLSAPLLKRSNAVSKFPAWTAKQRPASAMQKLEWQWLLPLQELQAAFASYLHTSRSQIVWCSSRRTWQGLCFQQNVEVTTASGAAPSTQLGAFLHIIGLTDGSVCSVKHKLRIAACGSSPDGQQQGAHDDIVLGPRVRCHKSSEAYGNHKLVDLGFISSWAAAEAKLRELGLVHSDGCLHMTITITDVM